MASWPIPSRAFSIERLHKVCDTADVRPFCLIVLAMIALAGRGGACTYFYPSIQVGPNFRVKVEDNGRPVKGLRVEIASDQGSDDPIVAATDKKGFALFRGVRPGSYHLRAEHDAGVPDGAHLEVKVDVPTGVTVPLRWPSLPLLLVRSLKGTMRGPDYLPGQHEPGLSLDLLDVSSGRKLKTVQTSDNGEFNFEYSTPGRYFLSLNPPGQGGFIAVAVDRDARTEQLDLDIGWSSCGLYYSDTSTCPQSELQTEEVSGRVVDSGGAMIPRAKILLLDPAGTVVRQLQSDDTGRFTSSGSLAGTYLLVVSSGGFTPYRRTVHVKPARDQARRSLITVQLGALGRCSSAHAQ